VSTIEELIRTGNGGGLLRGDLFGAEDEASHPLREAADHLPTILRDSAVPVLRPGRRNHENPLANQSQHALGAIASKSTVGTPAALGGPGNLRKLHCTYYLTI